jgi:hypothetical protein
MSLAPGLRSTDSLQTVIDKFKLQKQASGWVTRQGGEPPLRTMTSSCARSRTSSQAQQNTEAVRSPNLLISARMVSTSPPSSARWRKCGANRPGPHAAEGAELTKQEGQTLLEKLRGKTLGFLSAPQTVSREKREGLTPRRRRRVSGRSSKLPRWVSKPPRTHVLYRVDRVIDIESVGRSSARHLPSN